MLPVIVGDSLSVGTAPFLEGFRTDARVGRPLAEGLPIVRAHRRRPVVVVALGTNDVPDVARFRAAARRVARWRGDRCTVWITVRRRGYDFGGVNRTLPSPKVRWAAVTRRRPALLASDGVHATPQGYRVRARLIRREVRAAC